MKDMRLLATLDSIPENIVEGIWNGDVEETDKEHLNMVVNGVAIKDLEELVSWLNQRKTKELLEHDSLRTLVILLYAILEKGGEAAYVAAKVHLPTSPHTSTCQ